MTHLLRSWHFYKEIGITRISDITFMDRLYIPNYSVTLPGTDDIFWVYGGQDYKDSSESKRSDGINRKVLLQCIKLIQELLSEDSYLHLSDWLQ